jgi:hypothetical protein
MIKNFKHTLCKCRRFEASFSRANFLLGKKFIQRKKGPFFETGGKVSATIAVKCLGTRCESGTVAPL